MTALIDLTGHRYHALTLIDRARNTEDGKVQWNAVCDCGSKLVVRAIDVRHNRKKSCGCRRYRTGSDNARWGGHEQITLAKWGRIQRRNRYVTSRIGHAFDITMEYAWGVYEKQGGLCALTGIQIGFGRTGRDPDTASMDRIDSRFGYVVGNIQWVHKDLNRMKSVFDQDYFIDMCRLVSEHAGKKSVVKKKVD